LSRLLAQPEEQNDVYFWEEEREVKKKRLKIDEDLLQVARDYVNAQLDIMSKYGNPANVGEEKFNELVEECAQYPQLLRNMRSKQSS